MLFALFTTVQEDLDTEYREVLVGVFSTKEKAEQCAKDERISWPGIREVEIDKVIFQYWA